MPVARFLVGIDLGTTNTVVAYHDRETGPDAEAIRLFEIEQLVALGEVAARPQLPSLRYLPAPGELNAADIALPWCADATRVGPEIITGELARELGAQVPGRLVASAKSWLSHRSVDRTAPILPWGASEDVTKISPLDASAGYLSHVRAAWNQRFPDHRLETQELILTVPASFDEGARNLTVEAARLAGLPQVHLLEEPQAAFYDWIAGHKPQLAAALGDVRLVLVCDVGGGTTDLTLIRVEPSAETTRFTRIGVGDHLMLGGDNMDLGLAHLAEARINTDGNTFSAAQFNQLTQRCRLAKERLLAADAPDTYKVTVLGAGAKLIGAARSTELSRDEVREMLREGFFPRVDAAARPQRLRAGIVEFGLPYAADPAVSRQIALFLNQHQRVARAALGQPPGADDDRLVAPDAVLLNGGVFRSPILAERLLATLGDWRGAPLRLLDNAHPEWAVARGAVAFGLARAGAAPRIGGGAARSYFLALEDQRGICLLPRGTEEGAEQVLESRTFALRLGQPVRFHLHSSTADTPWRAGDLVELERESMLALPPIATVLDAAKATNEEIPVRLAATLTEVGTLDVQCLDVEDRHQRWRLEFQLRAQSAPQIPQVQTAEHHPRLAEATERLEISYGKRARSLDPRAIKRLRSDLEKILGGREQWDTALLRDLFGALWDRAPKRRRSVDHERIWFNLAGYCLRPGFGYALDDWRVQELWSIYSSGLQHVREARSWAEWWILWRRVAGGLEETAQVRLLDDMAYYLQPPGRAGVIRPAGAKKLGYDDMVRLAAALERIPVERKLELGAWLLKRLEKPRESLQTWGAIGRLAAREPLYASAHTVIPTVTAASWLERLLALDWKQAQPAAFAAALIARKTGDRERDLDPQLCRQVIERLQTLKTPTSWARMVQEVITLEAADQKRLLGDSIPQGLRLMH